MPAGVGRAGSRMAVAPRGQRERQRVAEPVGEEQLGDRQEAVVLGDAEHAVGVRLGRRLQAPVAVHDALRQAGGAGAVQPEGRRVGRRRRDTRRRLVVELVPGAADHDGVLDARRVRRDPSEVVGERRRDDDGPSPASATMPARSSAVSIVEIGTGTTPARRAPRNHAGNAGSSLTTSTTRSPSPIPSSAKACWARNTCRLQVGVGERRSVAADGDPVAPSGLDVTVDEPRRRVVTLHPLIMTEEQSF